MNGGGSLRLSRVRRANKGTHFQPSSSVAPNFYLARAFFQSHLHHEPGFGYLTHMASAQDARITAYRHDNMSLRRL